MNRLLSVLGGLLLIGPLHAAEVAAPTAQPIVRVRHGYDLRDPNAEKKLGPPLAPIGVAQAHLVGARLAGLPTRFDALFVSPMQRARATAAIIAGDLPGPHLEAVDALVECTPPTWRKKIMAQEKPTELAACLAQCDRLFAGYFKPASGHERTELMVCHGNVIRNMVVRALGVDTSAWLEMSVGNASITRIRAEADGKFKIISVGDVGHVPPKLCTGASGDPARSLAIPALPQPAHRIVF